MLELLPALAKAKARSAPILLRRAAELAWLSRWWAILAVATHNAFAASLLGENAATEHFSDGFDPPLGDVMEEGRVLDSPAPSSLPIRG